MTTEVTPIDSSLETYPQTTKPGIIQPPVVGGIPGNAPKMSATVQKTSIWAGIFFVAAIVAMAVASHYVYCSWKEKNPSLLIPVLFWALVATIIGTAGEILDKKPKVETITGDRRAAFSVDPPAAHMVGPPAAHILGQPVPIVNFGNTCFINALTQGLMNDDQLAYVFKTICERARARHQVFFEFLSLFPSQTIFTAWFSWIWKSEKNDAKLLAVKGMRDVLAMLEQRKSKLGYDTKNFKNQYPDIAELITKFSRVRKEADFPVVVDDNANLCQKFTSMKDDQQITIFFSNERSEVARRIAGFDAYLNLITSYERAMKEEPHTVFLGEGLSSSNSCIENIRLLIQRAGNYSEEDAAELLDCLSQYIYPGDYPEAFFSLIHERTWMECPSHGDDTKQATNEKRLAKQLEKHNSPSGPNDQLTTLPDDNVTRSSAEPCCILRLEIQGIKDEDGQKLLDKILNGDVRANQADPEESVVYMKNGKAKLYYAISEQLRIEQSPARFILQLKRFQCNGAVKQKVTCDVNMPLEIKMVNEVYELKSIVVHHGISAEGGHYTAVLKKTIEGKTTWWNANDSQVTLALDENIQTALKQGYLYFYVKKVVVVV